jgi:hypothetical protein
MSARLTVVFFAIAVSLHADEVTRDLTKKEAGLADYVKPGDFQLKVTNALPQFTYTEKSGAVLHKGEEPPAVAPGTPCASDATITEFLRFKLKDVKSEEQIVATVTTATASFTDECKASAKRILASLTTSSTPWVMTEESKRLEIARSDDKDLKWVVLIEPKRTQAQIEAKAKEAAAAKDRLAEERELVDKHSSLIVMKCSYSSKKCASEQIFVNADQDSTVYITDVPTGKKVTITAGASEYYPCRALSFNTATFTTSSETLAVSLQMKRNFMGIWPARMPALESEAASLYGLDWCPGEDRVFQKKSLFGIEREPAEFEARVRRQVRHLSNSKSLEDAPDPRLKPVQPPLNAIPLFLRGRSELVKIDIEVDGETEKTFTIPVRYQRFWLDAGGFFVFARHVDEQLEYEPFTATDTTRKVKRILKDTSTDPVTGIMVNIHPGNFPVLAFQFGLASNQGRLPSYYLGLGLRARSIGKRGLATIGAGMAMQQEDRFNNTDVGVAYPTDSARLIASRKYGFNPYLSISLGFSFGGVSESADVRSAPTSN